MTVTDLAPADQVQALIREKVRSAFRSANRSDPRLLDLTLSMSSLGACTRQGAYKLAGTPADVEFDPLSDEKRMAWLGTWQHRGLLPLLRRVMRRSRTEVPVTLSASGITIKGSVDLWWKDTVVDVKTKTQYGVERARTYGPYEKEWHQVRGYAAGLVQSRGADIRWIALVLLDRATGDSETFVRPYGADEAEHVDDRIADLVVASRNPGMTERDERGPGLSVICDGCPFLRRCWGQDATPGQSGAQKNLAVDPDVVASALTMYDDARQREKQAKDDREFARLILQGQPEGTYGDMVLGWSKASNGGNVAKPKAWDALTAGGVDLEGIANVAGVDLPRTPPGSPSIKVTHRGEDQ